MVRKVAQLLPKKFRVYYLRCRKTKFTQRPDYETFKSLVKDALRAESLFDSSSNKDPEVMRDHEEEKKHVSLKSEKFPSFYFSLSQQLSL